MGKSAISMVIFNSYVTNYQRVTSNMTQSQNFGFSSQVLLCRILMRSPLPRSPPSMSIFVEHLSNKNIEKTYKTGWWFGTFGLFFHIYWECHHPNWRTHIFQRGRSTTNQKISTRFPATPLDFNFFGDNGFFAMPIYTPTRYTFSKGAGNLPANVLNQWPKTFVGIEYPFTEPAI